MQDGRNNRSNIIINDTIHNININIDSEEEYQFYIWCIYAVNHKVLIDFDYQPNSFILSEEIKTKIGDKNKTLLRRHGYTPDFSLKINTKGKILLNEFKSCDINGIVYIDVKG